MQQFVIALHKLNINCNFRNYLQSSRQHYVTNLFLVYQVNEYNHVYWKPRMLRLKKQFKLLPAWIVRERHWPITFKENAVHNIYQKGTTAHKLAVNDTKKTTKPNKLIKASNVRAIVNIKF